MKLLYFSAGTPTGCVPTFKNFPGQGSRGGTIAGKINNEQECLDYCNANKTCLAIDFNSQDNPPSCFIQTNPLYTMNVYKSANVDQQQLVTRCPVSILPGSIAEP